MEYEVETILDTRLYGRKKALQYLVKWKGYPSEENTWQSEDDLKNSQDLMSDFHRNHPGVPRRISATLNFRPYENYTVHKNAKKLVSKLDKQVNVTEREVTLEAGEVSNRYRVRAGTNH